MLLSSGWADIRDNVQWLNMPTPVESHPAPAASTVSVVVKKSRRRSRARQLIKVLTGKKNILITAHRFADPDAIAAATALNVLLTARLPQAHTQVTFRGSIAGGLNQAFIQETNLQYTPWDRINFADFDAIVLVDTQPGFTNSPLPDGVSPTAVIDHHRSRGRPPKCAFSDLRPDVGASCSIIFSYFLELDVPIAKDLAATLLFAIESDLAGAAGQPGELDNMALASLTLQADPRKLYRMRYVNLPESYYIAYANALNCATCYDNTLVAHIGHVETPEQPAIIADFLLRMDKINWALVTADDQDKLILSLRSKSGQLSAAAVMRRLVRKLGEGGGHRAKAGGFVRLTGNTAQEIDRMRELIRRRLLRVLKISAARGRKIVPNPPAK